MKLISIAILLLAIVTSKDKMIIHMNIEKASYWVVANTFEFKVVLISANNSFKDIELSDSAWSLTSDYMAQLDAGTLKMSVEINFDGLSQVYPLEKDLVTSNKTLGYSQILNNTRNCEQGQRFVANSPKLEMNGSDFVFKIDAKCEKDPHSSVVNSTTTQISRNKRQQTPKRVNETGFIVL